jgi:hypothetical protein
MSLLCPIIDGIDGVWREDKMECDGSFLDELGWQFGSDELLD